MRAKARSNKGNVVAAGAGLSVRLSVCVRRHEVKVGQGRSKRTSRHVTGVERIATSGTRRRNVRVVVDNVTVEQ
jgi:hypothetical protein